MEYEESKQLRKSEKSMVYLVREKDGDQVYIRKILKGKHSVYTVLQSIEHPFLPKLYEVDISDDATTIIEEYIEGQSLGREDLSEKQLLIVIRELCTVLEFLHGKGIIHRDIKPSNIILAGDGHIRLIDFDAARMPKVDLEQDTELLGTRGYAPPEQYGFAQTDERADIYALGVTMQQLLGDKAEKPRYKRIVQKCTNLNPDKRYQSVRQVRRAFSYTGRYALCGAVALLLAALLGIYVSYQSSPQEETQYADENLGEGLVVLPAPENPHWDGETGIALWDNVLESGTEGAVLYNWRLYRADTAVPPAPDDATYFAFGDMGKDWEISETFEMSLAENLEENGFYYFAVSAKGDGIQYANSPYAVSDAFEYTGESAPTMTAPTGLAWETDMSDGALQYYATWDNLDDYADKDSFMVSVYNQSGTIITNNIWTKEMIMSIGYGGIWISPEFIAEGDAYRFTVEVYSSRPNEYHSFTLPTPVPEEYYSPWYYTDTTD